MTDAAANAQCAELLDRAGSYLHARAVNLAGQTVDFRDQHVHWVEAGAEVIVAQTVQDALAKIDEGFSAAVLDFALMSETVEPVATHLAECCVRFVFYTGHLGIDELLAKWPGSTIHSKAG
jgi:hypothetical protein